MMSKKYLCAASLAASACMLITVVAGASFCEPDARWTTAFVDDFDGDTLNPLTWNVHVGSDDSLCRDSCCTAENVVVHDGKLVLLSKHNSPPGCSYPYTSGAVTTEGKKSWASSPVFRLCVSAMLPGGGGQGAGAGVWPAHWLMPDIKICWPDGGEIDILEMINGDGFGHGTYHYETTYPGTNCSYPKGHVSVTAETALPGDWSTAYHEYAVEHGPTYLAYVYDGVTIFNKSSTEPPGDGPRFFPFPFYLLLNTALGGQWPGPVEKSTVFPTNHTIDYVRVVTKAA